MLVGVPKGERIRFPGFFDAGAPIRIGSRKRREIMRAHYAFGRPDHCLLIHRIRIVINVARQKRRANTSATDAIAISFRLGRVPRVKIIWHVRIYSIHSHRRWQHIVQRDDEILLRYRALNLYRGNLRQRVDSGVGPSRSLRQDIFARQPLQAIGERALYRPQSGLNLPAVKIRAVISQRNFEIAPQWFPQ